MLKIVSSSWVLIILAAKILLSEILLTLLTNADVPSPKNSSSS